MREQKLHFGRLGALFCEFWDEEEEEDEGAGDVGAFWECLDGAEDAAKAEVVEERGCISS